MVDVQQPDLTLLKVEMAGMLASAVDDCALARPVSEPGPVATDFTVASHVGPFGSAITMLGVVVGSSA